MSAIVPFAIVLRDAGHPNADAIRRAFRTFHHLTDADAIRLAANAQGVLMRQLGGDEARALQQALVKEGVNAVLVKEEDLRLLPASRLVQRLDLSAGEIIITDSQGRVNPVKWSQFTLVAAGAVPHVEIEATSLQQSPLWGRWTKPESPRSRLTTGQHLVLELIVAPDQLRYEIQAHRFPFQFVLDQPTASLTEKFVWLTREVTRHAPQAQLNRGAADIRDGVVLVRGYPSRQAMLDEMTWLLWSRAQGQ